MCSEIGQYFDYIHDGEKKETHKRELYAKNITCNETRTEWSKSKHRVVS